MRKIVFLIITTLTCVVTLSAQSDLVKDSLLNLVQRAKEDTTKADLLFLLGEQYENSDPAKAKYYLKLGGALSKKLKYEVGILKYYRMLAYVYAFQSKFDSLIYYNQLTLEISKAKKDTFNIGVALFNIGVGYRYTSDYESAIQYTLEGVKLLEGKGYTNIEAGLYGGLQALYMTLKQYDKAILYGEKSVLLGRKLENKNDLISSLVNLGLNYVEVGRLREAKQLNNEALVLAVKIGNKTIEAASLNNLCDIAQRENEIDLIKVYAERSLVINEQSHDLYGIMGSKQALSIYYLYIKQYDKARALALETLKICNDEDFSDGKGAILQILSTIAFASGDFRKGFQYNAEREKVEGELFTESLKQKEASMKVKHETEKKESQIKQLEAEKRVQELSISKKNTLNSILIGGAIILLIVSLLSYRTYKQKQKIQQQRIIELETEKKLTATEAVLKGEEQERSRLAKDLHDGLGGMLSGIKYSFNSMKGNLIMTPEHHQAFERSMDMLDGSIKEMRRVAHNMMPEALVKFGLDTALNDFCNEINQSGVLQISYQSVDLAKATLEQTMSITIYRIVQELISNSIKHAAAKKVVVQVTKTHHQLAVTVEDDGKGFDTNVLGQSKGIGWTNIQHRVDFLKGKLDIHSQPGKGTSVYIEFVT